MVIRKRKLGTKALERVLKYHDPYCSIRTFEGGGRCSCGRNQAIAELRMLIRRLADLQLRQGRFL